MLPEMIESILEIEEVEAVPAELGRARVAGRRNHHPDGRIAEVRAAPSHSVPERQRCGSRADEAAGIAPGEFADLVTRISERVPDCGIGVDVICGFPGESDEDFLRTFEYVERLPITYVHAFTYSPRPGFRSSEFHRTGAGGSRQTPHARTEATCGRQAPALRTSATSEGSSMSSSSRRVAVAPQESADGPTTTSGSIWEKGRVDARLEPIAITGLTESGLSGVHASASWTRRKERRPTGIVPTELSTHEKKTHRASACSYGTGRCPVGFSADILVGARHDLHMQVHPRPHVRSPI